MTSLTQPRLLALDDIPTLKNLPTLGSHLGVHNQNLKYWERLKVKCSACKTEVLLFLVLLINSACLTKLAYQYVKLRINSIIVNSGCAHQDGNLKLVVFSILAYHLILASLVESMTSRLTQPIVSSINVG